MGYILSNDTPPASLQCMLQKLKAETARLEAALARSEAELPASAVEIHLNVPELHRRGVAKLSELLAEESARPEAKEAIRSLINRTEVSPLQTGRGPAA